MGNSSGHRSNLQLIWGVVLMIVGIAVFVRIPQVMPELEKIQQFKGVTGFIRICFYAMGIILIGGGAKKLVKYFQNRGDTSETPPDNNSTENKATR
jgi:uncharacterized membrane protein HdeD (DUF308 family)